MKDLIKSVSKLSFSTILNIICGIIRNKILAITIGVAGIGVLSQLSNISGIIFAIIPIGSMGIVKYASQYFDENNKEELSSLFRIFLTYNIPIAFIITIVLLIFSGYFSSFIFSNNTFSYLIILYSISVPLGLIGSFIEIYLRSYRKINFYVKYVSYSAIYSLIIFIPLQFVFQLNGAILFLSVTSIIGIAVGVYYIFKLKIFPNLKSKVKLDKGIIKNIFKIGTAMMIMLILQQGNLLLIKSIIADKYGINFVGVYQTVFSISNNYLGLFFAIIGTYSIPKISTFKNKDDINKEINLTLKLLLLLYTPLICLCFIFRYYLIIILYTKDFLPAIDLAFYQFLGDYLKAISWVLGLWLVPQMKIKQWFFFDVVYNFNFLLVFFYMLNKDFNVKSISIAYVIANLIHVFINYFYIRSSLLFKFADRNILILITSFLILLILFFSSEFNLTLGYYLFVPLLTIWSFMTVRKFEINQFKTLILDKIKSY